MYLEGGGPDRGTLLQSYNPFHFEKLPWHRRTQVMKETVKFFLTLINARIGKQKQEKQKIIEYSTDTLPIWFTYKLIFTLV